MARTSYKTLVEDPHQGDRVPLARIAERYDLPANTVSYRYRAGKRGHDLIKPHDERRIPLRMRSDYTAAPTDQRQEIIAAALNSPGVRALVVPMAAIAAANDHQVLAVAGGVA